MLFWKIFAVVVVVLYFGKALLWDWLKAQTGHVYYKGTLLFLYFTVDKQAEHNDELTRLLRSTTNDEDQDDNVICTRVICLGYTHSGSDLLKLVSEHQQQIEDQWGRQAALTDIKIIQGLEES